MHPLFKRQGILETEGWIIQPTLFEKIKGHFFLSRCYENIVDEKFHQSSLFYFVSTFWPQAMEDPLEGPHTEISSVQSKT